MKRLLCLVLFSLGASQASAAVLPRWVTTSGSEVPFDSFATLTGYGMANLPGKGADAIQSAKDQALKDLAGKLKIQVDAASRVTDTQEGKANFSTYQSDVKTMVSLSLSGIQNYETAFDTDKNLTVALAILDKATMRLSLASDRGPLVAQLDADLHEVRVLAQRGRLDLLQQSLKVFDLHLDELVQNVAVSRLLGEGIDPQAVVQGFYDAKTEVKATLLSEQLLTMTDVIGLIIKSFPWKEMEGKSLILTSAVYKTSDFSGQFFAYLRDDLEEAVRRLVPTARIVADTDDARPDFVLLGSYREAGAGYQVKFRLNDVVRQRPVSPLDFELDAAFVKSQKLEFVPVNLRLATVDRDLQVAVYDRPILTRLRVWTDKGRSGLTLKEGDKYYFYVNVNRPGYLSLIYNIAGLKPFRVALLNNYRIDESQIGSDVRLEQEFEVAPPFGSESAHFFFSPDPMDPPATVRTAVEGVPYDVVAQDYATLLVATRGVKSAGVTTEAATLKTDATLTITTVPKR